MSPEKKFRIQKDAMLVFSKSFRVKTRIRMEAKPGKELRFIYSPNWSLQPQRFKVSPSPEKEVPNSKRCHASFFKVFPSPDPD